ncbi:hypothetical protein ACN47E_000537 [Coniothyrium glycines]
MGYGKGSGGQAVRSYATALTGPESIKPCNKHQELKTGGLIICVTVTFSKLRIMSYDWNAEEMSSTRLSTLNIFQATEFRL